MTVEFTILARPSSRKELIELDGDGKTMIVHVTEAAERSRANKAIVKCLAKFLGINTASVSIVHGMMSSTKRIRIDGINTAEFDAKLQSLAGTS